MLERLHENYATEVIHFPPGTTSITQPLDVGIMKPFKNHIRSFWRKNHNNTMNMTAHEKLVQFWAVT